MSMLIELNSVYAVEEFCEQVVTEAVILFVFDVIDQLLVCEWISVGRGGTDVFCVLAESTVVK